MQPSLCFLDKLWQFKMFLFLSWLTKTPNKQNSAAHLPSPISFLSSSTSTGSQSHNRSSLKPSSRKALHSPSYLTLPAPSPPHPTASAPLMQTSWLHHTRPSAESGATGPWNSPNTFVTDWPSHLQITVIPSFSIVAFALVFLQFVKIHNKIFSKLLFCNFLLK